MPIQIIEGNKQPSFMQSILGGLVRGLTAGQEKYEQLKGRNESRDAVKSLVGPERGDTVSKLPPELQKLFIEHEYKQKRATAELQGNRKQIEAIEQEYGYQPGELSKFEENPNLAHQVAKSSRPPKKTQSSQPIDPEQLAAIQSIRNDPRYEKASPLRKYQMMTDGGVSKENAKAEADIASEQEKPTAFESEASKLAAKSSSEVRDTIVREYEGAESSDFRIDKMMKAAKGKTLSTPLMIKALDFLGLPLSVLKNPTTEEYAKLQNDYVRDVSSIFPGAIKNFEIESYLKTIPTLLNSDEGKILVGNNIKIINKAKKIRYNAMNQILKENEGVVPRNLDIAINDRIRNEMEGLKEEFNNNTLDALEMAGPTIAMVDEKGRVFDIPSHEIERAMEDGLRISNE